MAEYLKSHDELLKIVNQAAKDLRPEDLIPYLQAAEKWDDSKDTFFDEDLDESDKVNR
ncbi:hypothetical protein [Lentilactobacillus buchneri]|uniref:Uncharacterized protein n=1 Tax=Lentilactobacillus buchneri DSM 20057 TaxID=1423728 RepID=A0A4R5NV54_LENBU|nr:hypothetical protein [Lentilactobacillus buchneri]WCJ51331.1 YtxH domain-containing protein [Lentilactobacillus sp. Egmn17]AEB72840.1 hypothetical protein Lbuc_0574 [Lentilactobacillus buchneri NRRL B-30929]MCT2882130.1 YtxH domain-containing protein [Lentilactobacillus buchneri]MCT2897824.1 YtxH domain-containing protein [Lentilactobacillus buchneri]MCT3253628.1 YtxH domain-containing protein [Lentilactobacillus buchneri]